MANPADISIPQCTDSFEEAIGILKLSHAQWCRNTIANRQNHYRYK
ncbi:MAG TPA: hypothetical protein V6D29_23895 [Leptolyngbyaceae cyanobacterium]